MMSPTKARALALLQASNKQSSALGPEESKGLVSAIGKQPKGKPLSKKVLGKCANLSSRTLKRMAKKHLVGEDGRTLTHMASLKEDDREGGGGGAASSGRGRGGGGAAASASSAPASASSKKAAAHESGKRKAAPAEVTR
jgi:hypothetical protein